MKHLKVSNSCPEHAGYTSVLAGGAKPDVTRDVIPKWGPAIPGGTGVVQHKRWGLRLCPSRRADPTGGVTRLRRAGADGRALVATGAQWAGLR